MRDPTIVNAKYEMWVELGATGQRARARADEQSASGGGRCFGPMYGGHLFAYLRYPVSLRDRSLLGQFYYRIGAGEVAWRLSLVLVLVLVLVLA